MLFGSFKKKKGMPPEVSAVLSAADAETREFLRLNAGFAVDRSTHTAAFCNPKKNIYRIVLKRRNIVDFPGIEDEEAVLCEYEESSYISPYTKYHYGFYPCEDGSAPFYMSWTLQPDGMYYADSDGFGAERQAEITLSAYMDDEGRFISKFKMI